MGHESFESPHTLGIAQYFSVIYPLLISGKILIPASVVLYYTISCTLLFYTLVYKKI